MLGNGNQRKTLGVGLLERFTLKTKNSRLTQKYPLFVIFVLLFFFVTNYEPFYNSQHRERCSLALIYVVYIYIQSNASSMQAIFFFQTMHARTLLQTRSHIHIFMARKKLFSDCTLSSSRGNRPSKHTFIQIYTCFKVGAQTPTHCQEVGGYSFVWQSPCLIKYLNTLYIIRFKDIFAAVK